MVKPSNDPVDVKSKTVSLRITDMLNHFLETRVLELRAVAENKRGIDKSWLMLRLMELGQDWLASYHLGQETDYEDWLRQEISKREKNKNSELNEGFLQGLIWAHTKFEEYEELVCKIGGEGDENAITPNLPDL